MSIVACGQSPSAPSEMKASEVPAGEYQTGVEIEIIQSRPIVKSTESGDPQALEMESIMYQSKWTLWVMNRS